MGPEQHRPGGRTRGCGYRRPGGLGHHTGARSFIVAILDTGIDTTHPGPRGQPLDEPAGDDVGKPDVDDDGNGQIDDFFGYDFIGNKADPADDVYHGTYVAGIIGAFDQQQMGIAGVNWNVSMMICKVADKDGVKLDAAVAAVQYATASGAKIINASWGGPEYSKSLEDAIEAAGKKGVLFVAAAGNDSTNNDKARSIRPTTTCTTSSRSWPPTARTRSPGRRTTGPRRWTSPSPARTS